MHGTLTKPAGVMGSFFLVSGYFISRDDIPWYWIFMHYLSLFKYPFESFMINEYGGKRRCLESVQGKCFLYGDTYLIQQGLKQSRKWSNLGVMSGFIHGYTFLCFLVLCYRSYRARCQLETRNRQSNIIGKGLTLVYFN